MAQHKPTAHKRPAGRSSPRRSSAHKPVARKLRARNASGRKRAVHKRAVHSPLQRKHSARTLSRSRLSARKVSRRKPAAIAKSAATAKRTSLAKRTAVAKHPVHAAGSAFRFKPGDRIVTRRDIPRGHCRTPYYLRGQPGVIERCLGHFRNPETRAYGKPGLPKAGLYTVRYELPRLWQGYAGVRADTLVADIFEFWLDPA